MKLISKTRKINTLLQQAAEKPVDFKAMSETLSEVIGANVMIIAADGELLGIASHQIVENAYMNTIIEERQVPEEYAKHLLEIQNTTPNLDINSKYSAFGAEDKNLYDTGLTTVVPIKCGGERLATLVLARLDSEFKDEDLILAEYGATVVGMEILRKNSELIAQETRSKAIVQMAINSLSYSETEALQYIFKELDGSEGLLVASRIADHYGITRSVIVNALRKLESAGVIESRSLGMKGTYIKVLNAKLLPELEKAAAGIKLFA